MPGRRGASASVVVGSARGGGGGAKAGDIVLVQARGRRGSGPRVLRRIGRPDRARDVIEALMLDRGLRRTFSAELEQQAREAARTAARSAGERRDLRSLRHLHDRPRQRARLRRCDLRRGGGGRRLQDLGAHRGRLRPRRGGRRARPRGPAQGHERVRPRNGRADAPARPLQRRLLADARRRAAGGDRRARARARERARAQQRLLPLADPLRRAPGLRRRGSHLRRRGAPAGRRGRSRWPVPGRRPRRSRGRGSARAR